MKGYVYCIRSHQTELVYIGSTEQILCKRMSDHRSSYKRRLNNKRYATSFEIMKYDDCYIELIEEGDFESKLALRAREGHYQRTMDCVNKRIENRTQKEYYTENKQEINQKQKEYYTENKQELLQKRKEYYTENKQEIDQKRKENYTENKQEIDQKRKEYYIENKQEIDQKHKEYYTENKQEIDQKRKEYYTENKQEIDQKRKDYYNNNKAYILERQNEKVVCECGCEVSKVNLPAHIKSKKHCVLIEKKCVSDSV